MTAQNPPDTLCVVEVSPASGLRRPNTGASGSGFPLGGGGRALQLGVPGSRASVTLVGNAAVSEAAQASPQCSGHTEYPLDVHRGGPLRLNPVSVPKTSCLVTKTGNVEVKSQQQREVRDPRIDPDRDQGTEAETRAVHAMTDGTEEPMAGQGQE